MDDGGRPDFRFASPVSEDMKAWSPAQTIVGFYADSMCVVYANSSAMRAFSYNIQFDLWSAPIRLSDFFAGPTPVSCVPHNNRLKFTFSDGRLYEWDYPAGGASVPWAIQTPWTMGRPGRSKKTIRGLEASGEHDNAGSPLVTFDVFKNHSAAADETVTFSAGATKFESEYLDVDVLAPPGSASGRPRLRSAPRPGTSTAFPCSARRSR
jgi:hypothetical protein